MREGIWDWEQSPLILVFADGYSVYPSDGHHRIQSAIAADQPSILVEIRQGTLREARWEIFASNKLHGLSLTNADKQERIRTILKDAEWSCMSDRAIASHCGVSAPYVGKIRAELSSNDAVSTSHKGRDGKVRQVPPATWKKDSIKKAGEEIRQELIEESKSERTAMERDLSPNESDRHIPDLILEFGAKTVAEQALEECTESEMREIARELMYQLQILDLNREEERRH